MGRPSVKEKRTTEILEAFEKCVAKYGVEGSTLERIAEAAGLRRSLLRHYIGNKEELLEALVERFFAESNAQSQQMLIDLKGCSACDLIEYLFYDDGSETHSIRIAHALFQIAPENPKLAEQLMEWVQNFDRNVTSILRETFPEADQVKCQQVAHGVVALYANVASLSPIGETTEIRGTAKKTAMVLIGTLSSN